MPRPKPGQPVAYKIHDPKTGLFQRGGSGMGGCALWSKQGKTWNTMGHVRAHLSLLRSGARFGPATIQVYERDPVSFKAIYKTVPNTAKDPIDPDWEIIELTVSTTQSAAYRCGDIIDEVK